MLDAALKISHYALPVLAVLILVLCLVALLKRRLPSLGNAKVINTANGDAFALRYRETSIGRSPKSDIVLNYSTVSRLHAVIVCSKKGWYVADARSSTGVKINGKKIDRRGFIKSGDKIALGGAVLIFEFAEKKSK